MTRRGEGILGGRLMQRAKVVRLLLGPVLTAVSVSKRITLRVGKWTQVAPGLVRDVLGIWRMILMRCQQLERFNLAVTRTWMLISIRPS